MAGPEPASGSLPVFYGEHMEDGNTVERPKEKESGELIRYPINQPGPAHLNPETASPPGPSMPSEPPIGISTPSRAPSKRATYLNYSGDGRRSDEYYRSPRFDPYYPEYRGGRDREPYPEDYYDDDDRPRPYRRGPRRGSTRPPLSHENFHSRHPRGPGPSRSWDRRRSMDYYDEPDTPQKPRVHYEYSDEEEPIRLGYGHSGDGGRRGPPRRPPSTEEVMRLPWTMWMNSNAKNHFVAFVGEFVGTTMFLFFAFSGTQVANIGSSDSSQNTTTGGDTGFSPIVLLYIALVFGFSLMVNVWIFFRISGGLFNPAVTFAMLLTRSMTLTRFALLLVAQLAGSIFSSYLVSVLFPTKLNVRTTLSADTTLARGVFIEAVLTAELVFTIFMLAKEKHKATFIAPVGIGLALFIAELVGVFYTGGSLNPARSFGPCVVTGIFDREHWVYWVGPGIGAVLAVVFYKFIKILEYEMANPGQDDDDQDEKEKTENDQP